jgi:hypothetical protein
MPLVEDLFASFVAHARQLEWEGVRGETKLDEVRPDAGVDLARGPWIKFTFEEHGKLRSLQGYFLYTGKERIKLDGNEVENDDVSLEISGSRMIVTFSGRREVNHKIFPFLYLFSAKV